MQFAEQLKESAEVVPETLSSPEIAGQLGQSQTFINKSHYGEVVSQVEEFADRLKTAANKAENYSDLVTSMLEASSESGVDHKLAAEDDQDREYENTGLMFLGICGSFLDNLDKLTGINNHDVICDMVDNFDQQDVLSNVSSLCFLFFVSDQEFLFKYGNTFYRELPKVVDELEQVVQQDEPQLDELIELYRRWGPLCETAITPIVSLIHYLENEEVDLEKAEEMSLNDSVGWIEEFPPLASVGSRFNVYLRNGVLHGGRSAGYMPNLMTNEVKIWYKKGEETKTKVFSRDGFEKIVVETLTAVVTLFIVPLYLISSHATIEITEATST